MLRTIRLKKSVDISNVLKKGKYCSNNLFVLYYLDNGLNYNRFAVSSSKKIVSKVRKNRAKRLINEIYKLLEKKVVVGYDIVVIAKKSVLDADFEEIKSKFLSAITRCKIIVD